MQRRLTASCEAVGSPGSEKTIHSVDLSDGGGSVEDRGGAHVFLIPTSGGGFESALVMVFGGANTIHAAGRTTRLGGHAEQPCSSVRCRRCQLSDHMRFHARGAHTGGNERGLPRTFAVPKSRPAVVAESGSATEPTNERQSMNFEGDKSLDEALRQGADACADTNKLVSCLAPSVIASAGPNFHSPVWSMIFDLHLPKDIGADPFGILCNVEVPTVFPVTLFVIGGHASNSINRREGRCQRREGFAARKNL